MTHIFFQGGNFVGWFANENVYLWSSFHVSLNIPSILNMMQITFLISEYTFTYKIAFSLEEFTIQNRHFECYYHILPSENRAFCIFTYQVYNSNFVFLLSFSWNPLTFEHHKEITITSLYSNTQPELPNHQLISIIKTTFYSTSTMPDMKGRIWLLQRMQNSSD